LVLDPGNERQFDELLRAIKRFGESRGHDIAEKTEASFATLIVRTDDDVVHRDE